MNELETKIFEAGAEFQKAYDMLQDQYFMTRNTVQIPQHAINSPTHSTNCLHYFRQAKKILDAHPHPRLRKELARLYLQFEELRPTAEAVIGKEYPRENQYYKEMINAKSDFQAARKEAEAMLQEQ